MVLDVKTSKHKRDASKGIFIRNFRHSVTKLRLTEYDKRAFHHLLAFNDTLTFGQSNIRTNKIAQRTVSTEAHERK